MHSELAELVDSGGVEHIAAGLWSRQDLPLDHERGYARLSEHRCRGRTGRPPSDDENLGGVPGWV